MPPQQPARWWEGAVLYQVYVRSFADSNGDGFGDLRGLLEHLEHLVDLGVDGIWLSPTMPSPDTDWGYDVADYRGVHPELGTLEDLDALVKAAEAHNIAVLLDLVPNHTSALHPWFVAARAARDAPERDLYVWADPAPGGGPPNNWRDATGESAWSLDEASGQYYLHNFLETQPDLNWWNPAVHAAFAEILEFWFARGVAGFRIDVAHGLYKDAELRDDPVLAPEMAARSHYGLEPTYSANRPETHGVFREWRRLAEATRPPRLLLGETWVFDLERLAAYYGDDDELQLGFNFPFALARFAPEEIARVVRATLAALGPRCPVWMASNHDIGRLASRWGGGDERRARLALCVLLSLPGTVVLYYGDELAMTDVAVPRHLQRDPMTWGERGGKANRDRCRTPMRWSVGETGGFCAPDVRPWLPLGEDEHRSVAHQRGEPTSVLQLSRALIALRHEHLAPGVAPYEEMTVAEDRLVYGVGDLVVAANFADDLCELSLPADRLLVSSTLSRPAGVISAPVVLQPFEAVVCVR